MITANKIAHIYTREEQNRS